MSAAVAAAAAALALVDAVIISRQSLVLTQ